MSPHTCTECGQPLPIVESERRRYTRVAVRLEADLYTPERVLLGCETRDISLRGLFLVTDQQLPVGTECRAVLWLCGVDPPLLLQFSVKVVRQTADGLGVEIDSVQEMNSYHHLVNLVAYNLGDPDLIRTEKRRLNDRTAEAT